MSSENSPQDLAKSLLHDVQEERNRWVAYEKEQGRYNFWLGFACGFACGLFSALLLLGLVFLIRYLLTTHH